MIDRGSGRDLPERFGLWQTDYERIARWEPDGTGVKPQPVQVRDDAVGRGSGPSPSTPRSTGPSARRWRPKGGVDRDEREDPSRAQTRQALSRSLAGHLTAMRLRPPLDQRPLHRLLDQPQPPGTGPRGPNPSRKSAPTWHGTTSCGATRCVTNGSATTPPKPMSCRSTRRSSCTGRSTPLQLCRTAALHIAERRELHDHVGPCPFWFSSISPGARCWTF